MGKDFKDGGLWSTAVIAAPSPTSFPRKPHVNPAPTHRHSGESRNPEGRGKGVQSETPSLNPL